MAYKALCDLTPWRDSLASPLPCAPAAPNYIKHVVSVLHALTHTNPLLGMLLPLHLAPPAPPVIMSYRKAPQAAFLHSSVRCGSLGHQAYCYNGPFMRQIIACELFESKDNVLFVFVDLVPNTVLGTW